jgi:NAD(P)-dependent dehydrogenase (short-subunit alcohol dehydrogenase family)
MKKKKVKTVVVFGALGFLGRHISELLSKEKCNLVISDTSEEECSLFLNELQANSKGSILSKVSDVTKEESLENLLKEVKKEFGRVDSIINCSTYSSKDTLKVSAPFENYQLSDWKEMLSVNLDGAFLIAKVFGSDMAKQGDGGSLIFMSSIYGFLGTDQSIYKSVNTPNKRYNNPASYSASKGGVISLAKYLASYWAEENIRVNVLSLGGIYNDQNEEFTKEYSKRVPMKRMGKLEELDGAIRFLLLDDSTYFTGQNLILDGGLSVW